MLPNPVMTPDELNAFFQQAFNDEREQRHVIEHVELGLVRLRTPYEESSLRPGGTISGPVIMSLADAAMYALVLAHIGPVGLAVTTSLNMNFLRKPGPGELVADARMLKLGKRLAVGEVTIYSADTPEPVAHATITYSIPPKR